ncbi:NERD domain-containing protein [Virgibacillus sp. NKC19-3]|uniref:nuclease-related domain-containing protein n=1 Tax=Virgibacillus saliphilus TaxID=2831674 RepID=UPI001C9B50CC|nr:nuclease-related domain-containing protein [Virgibacillus sp. NKC19-3]MBY7142508.1 NERD domain-containing protein [Virgibacillus sp. NKC19-3]
MAYKIRTKSKELIILEAVNKRKHLTSKEEKRYLHLKKGYEGEVRFDTITDTLQCDCFILNDLLLEVNNTTFQMDSLIIAPGKMYVYEVKNYEGDYYYQSDKLFKRPKLEVLNPLHQLSRSESLLHQLLLNLGFKPQIDASVVFINSAFTLYQAPLDKPIIFPTQVNQYIEKLNTIPSKLTEKHKKLADQLLAAHITDSRYNTLPSYDYEQLRKGITCLKCKAFSIFVEKRKCVCKKCGYEEPVTTAVLRSVKEFKTLFPNETITTNIIHNWCQVVPSKKTIRRILAANFTTIGVRQWTYYE